MASGTASVPEQTPGRWPTWIVLPSGTAVMPGVLMNAGRRA